MDLTNGIVHPGGSTGGVSWTLRDDGRSRKVRKILRCLPQCRQRLSAFACRGHSSAAGKRSVSSRKPLFDRADVNGRSGVQIARSRQSALVKSFGRRLASESPRGTNPRCAVRGLWRFVQLAAPGLIGLAFAVVFGIANPEVFPSDWGTGSRPPASKVADSVWGLSV